MEQLIAKLLNDFEQGKMVRRQVIGSGGDGRGRGISRRSRRQRITGGRRESHLFMWSPNSVTCRSATRFFCRATRTDGKTVQTPPLVTHIAYTIDNWDKNTVEEELKRRGLQPRPDTEVSFHVKDPDGFDLQISGKNMKA
jgi:hypothetical protein